MKKIFYWLIALSVVQNVHSQSVEGLIEKYRDRGYVITKVEEDIYKFEDTLSNKIYNKNFSDYKDVNLEQSIDSLIVVLSAIDTNLYMNKFIFWQDVPVTNGKGSLVQISDINRNGLPELYGYVKEADYPWHQPSPKVIYELNPDKSNFDLVYQYDSYKEIIFEVRAIYDINKTGSEQIIWDAYDGDLGPVYYTFKPPFFGSLPNQFDFRYQYNFGQLNGFKCGDFDGDNLTDVAVSTITRKLLVLEYNPIINNLDIVFSFSAPFFIDGIVVGDYDLDGKTDIAIGDVKGNFYIIENNGNDNYQSVFTGKVETYNVFSNFSSNDIDGNGKPELWIVGFAFYSYVPKIRLTCFEANGDNNFIPVYKIDIIGTFPQNVSHFSAIDVTNDGREELLVCIDNYVLLLQFKGQTNSHAYEIFYAKRIEFTIGNYWGATLYDLTNDGKKELLTSSAFQPPGKNELKGLTKIYKYNTSTKVEMDSMLDPENINLSQNYPNPFNLITKINFSVRSKSSTNVVLLKVYDIRGKEVKVLLNKVLSNGKYSAIWDGKNSSGITSSSGVYFIVLCSNELRKTIKILLIK